MFYDVPTASLEVLIDGLKWFAEPKRFKSGSVGWYCGGKQIRGGVKLQVSLSIVVVGSKASANGEAAAAPKPPQEDIVQLVLEDDSVYFESADTVDVVPEGSAEINSKPSDPPKGKKARAKRSRAS